jgi:lipoprotein-releasing system ATP-binding protein
MDESLALSGGYKSYGTHVKTSVLKNISLSFPAGEFSAIIGQSGSGKTTLLNLIGLLDRPDSGKVFHKGKDLFMLDDEALAQIRNRTFGFIFQFHHLLPEFTALENVLIPSQIASGRITDEGRQRALDLLVRVGLEHRINNRSTELSGGQQQRVAVARALMNRPEILLADEPTGNLDSDAGASVLELLRKINKESGTTCIIVTHDRHIAAACDRVISVADGIIKEDLRIILNSRDDWDKFAPCYCGLRTGNR